MKRRLLGTATALVLGLLLSTATAVAAEWGTLKGKFIYDGKPPVQKKLNVTKDAKICSEHQPMDESLVVSKEGGLANVVVYIRVKRGKKLKVHPDLKDSGSEPVQLDNLHCRFDPHIALLQTGQKLILKNSDPVGHNTNVFCFKNQPFNLLIPAGQSQEITTLTKGEPRPAGVACNIHPWMSGYLVVRDDPYMAVSAKDGSFEIKNIPAGEHEFQFWQDKGYLRNVSFKGGKTS
ncbi:MAG: hypothetical protein ACC645_18185, partial [Pirellulales bacterium]